MIANLYSITDVTFMEQYIFYSMLYNYILSRNMSDSRRKLYQYLLYMVYKEKNLNKLTAYDCTLEFIIIVTISSSTL